MTTGAAGNGASQYAASGVNLKAGSRAVDLMRAAVESTHGPEVLGGVGAFGGQFDAAGLCAEAAPVLVASTDGVGTKVRLAAQAGRWRGLGHDIVNHCVNDILCQGARPLFFLDYVASSRLVPEQVAEVVTGMAEACRAAGCALLGGETAEMPGVYAPGEMDVVGTVVGVVAREARLPRPGIAEGDVLLGLASSGPHTNGYSLIRRVFEGVPLDTVLPEVGEPLAEALLRPHRAYWPLLRPVLAAPEAPVKAVAHLTGGGLFENLPRVLPEGLAAEVDRDAWPVPGIFRVIQVRGEISDDEMHRVFNMGLGLVLVVAPSALADVQALLGEESWLIGRLTTGPRRVILR